MAGVRQVRQHLSAVIPELSLLACQPAELLASDYATLARGDG